MQRSAGALVALCFVAGCSTPDTVDREPTSTSRDTPPTAAVLVDVPNAPSEFTCTSRSGTVTDVLPPSSRSEASGYAQSPREAAQDVQTSRAFNARLGSGALTEQAVSANKATYLVVKNELLIGRISVRAFEFGAYAATHIEACST